MASVTLSGIRKIYQDAGRTRVAVADLDLAVNDGEFVVLVGPSGCGKSTTLRMVAGLETISAGELRIGDRVVNDVPARDRNVAMVFQNYALYPHMSVFDNMAFSLKLRRVPGPEIAARVGEAARILRIEPLLEQRPRQLSGGEQQRVALGRAIVRQPAVFLFDEPLSNLDAKLRVQMRREIARLHHALGATMLYVTHDQAEAMTLGDRVVVMRDGHVQQVDAPLAVYREPRNTFVAGFIGSPPMNLLAGEVVDDGGLRFVAKGGALALPLPGAWKAALGGPRPVILGVRPEDVSLAALGMTGVPARVDLVEPLGQELLIYASAGGQELTARVAPGVRAEVGLDVLLGFDPEQLHAFDPDSGERLPTPRSPLPTPPRR
ncbi:MAG: glycerol-3-phosphate ABC transporter ATP-binding protein [Gemmatimonadetes bacterium]|nr:MAG: glycerol-3-phosphate ABC transporter ATP-binding protein [Gemmatimonadota bacterium]